MAVRDGGSTNMYFYKRKLRTTTRVRDIAGYFHIFFVVLNNTSIIKGSTAQACNKVILFSLVLLNRPCVMAKYVFKHTNMLQ